MIRRAARGALLGLLVAALAPGALAAQSADVPADLQHGLFLRTLTFDRQLERMGPEVLIAVVYQPDHAPSSAARRDFMAAAAASDIRAIGGLPVRVVEAPLVDVGALVAGLRQAGVDVVYLTPVRAVDVRRLAQSLGAAGILSVTGVPDYVGQGIAVGVGRRGDRPRIMVDLAAARAAGSEFAAQLLKLAEVMQ